MIWATPRTALLVATLAALSAVDSGVGSVALRLPAFNDDSYSATYSAISGSSSSSSRANVQEALNTLNFAESMGSKCNLGAWLRRLTASASASDGGGAWWLGWAWGADATVSVVDRAPPVALAARPASFGRALDEAVMGYGIPMSAFTVPCEDVEDKEDVTGRDGGSVKVRTLVRGETENLGCPRLCPAGTHMPEPEEAWIAIVQRGRCSFVEKVREAQRFGAKAVIVGGDDPDMSGNPDVLVTMYSMMDASDVKIPSTFIKFTDYVRLSDLIAASNTSTSGIKTVSLQITADFASWEWYSPILTFLVLLLLPSLLTLATLLVHRIRATRAEQRERAPEALVSRLPWRVWTGSGWEKHSGPVPPDDIDILSVPKSDADLERGLRSADAEVATAGPPPRSASGATEGGGDAESVNPPWFDAQTECAICLNDFCVGDRVRVLPCKHIFHLAEIDEWLIHRKKLCPVCKTDVTEPAVPYTRPSPPASLPPSPTERTPLLGSHHRTASRGTLASIRSTLTALSLAASTRSSLPTSPRSSTHSSSHPPSPSDLGRTTNSEAR